MQKKIALAGREGIMLKIILIGWMIANVFISFSPYETKLLKYGVNVLVIGILVLSSFMYDKKCFEKIVKANKVTCVLYIVFTLASLVALGTKIHEYKRMELWLYPFVMMALIPLSYGKHNFLEDFSQAVFWGVTANFILSLVLTGNLVYMHNINQLGILAALLFGISITYINDFVLYKKKYAFGSIILLLSLVCLYLVFDSKSNTALFACCIAVLMLVIVDIMKLGFKRIGIVIGGTLGVFIVLYIIPITNKLLSQITKPLFKKLFGKGQSGKLLNGRGEIWNFILERSGLWGMRNPQQVEEEFGMAAHNIYLEILRDFGMIAAVIFCVLLMIIVVNSFIQVKYEGKECALKALSLVVLMQFIAIGFFESLLGTFRFYYVVLFVIMGYVACQKVKE